MQEGDSVNKQLPVFGAMVRLPLLVLWLLVWVAVAHLHTLTAAPLPDFAAGLAFALTLATGPTGLIPPLLGWLLCHAGGAELGMLSTPVPAGIHVIGYGLFGLVAREAGSPPEQVRGLLALWGIAAAGAAPTATLLALLLTSDQAVVEFLRTAAVGWLTGFTGIVVALVPLWARPVQFSHGVAWLPVAVACSAAFVVVSNSHWSLDEASRLTLFTGIALFATGWAALGAGLGGVAVTGLFFALAMVGLAVACDVTLPWAVLAVFALVQVAGTVLALVQEKRWELLQLHQLQQQRSEELRQSEMLRLVADHTSDIITVHDAEFGIRYASPQFYRLLGVAEDEPLPDIAALLPRLHPADRPAELSADLPSAGNWRYRIRGSDHQYHWLESSYVAVDEGELRRYVVISRDVGAHVEQTETLHAMALHDPLTQLYNRRAASTMGERLWTETGAQRMPFSVVLLDIDHFKRINDTYGHDVGDEVIKRVAAILPAYTRQRDLVCRWGGEEFLILLPESDIEGACRLAERVRAEVASTVVMAGDNRLQINISAGVAERSGSDADLAAVIERADQGLYAAKEQGRNRVVPMRNTA